MLFLSVSLVLSIGGTAGKSFLEVLRLCLSQIVCNSRLWDVLFDSLSRLGGKVSRASPSDLPIPVQPIPSGCEFVPSVKPSIDQNRESKRLTRYLHRFLGLADSTLEFDPLDLHLVLIACEGEEDKAEIISNKLRVETGLTKGRSPL